MTNKEIAETLRKAAEGQDNIALKMLLLMAAERLDEAAHGIKGEA